MHSPSTQVYRSVIHAVHNIYRQEGVHGFYRGLGPSLAQIAPYMALTFGFYEMFRRAWDVAVAEVCLRVTTMLCMISRMTHEYALA